MKENIFMIMMTIISLLFLLDCTPQDNMALFMRQRDRLFNDNWKFFRGDTSGAEQAGFDDAHWRVLDLPHDWSIEDLPGEPDSHRVGPFSYDSPGETSTGYAIGGTGWYRKHFILDSADALKKVLIYFDGIYMESDVWVNGHHVGYHPYGYTPFYYDITPFINPAGKANLLAVRVQNNGANSRWYSGSGIYRQVYLTVVQPLHIDVWGVHVTTPEISSKQAKINLVVTIKNDLSPEAGCLLMTKIIDMEDRVVGIAEHQFKAAANGTIEMDQTIDIEQPRQWSLESPYLYKAQVTLMAAGITSDIQSVVFGIRSIGFNAEKGLLLNGESIKLKGGCMHHDNGMLGSAAYARAEERRVELMKTNGFNAIRTSHNPPSQSFLDACDRLGLLVVDEAFDMWERAKRPQDYHRFFKDWWQRDLQSMLRRDRNHPSVIMWSIGNEVNERADTSGFRIARQLINTVRGFDTSRPISNAICSFWDHSGKSWDDTAPAFALLDIGGYNYQWREYFSDHKKYPERIMYGSESIPREAWENWQQVQKNSYVIGDFVWTGMDYLGETGIGHTVYRLKDEKDVFAMPWPWYNAWCGDIDICGNKKPQSYYRDVVWGNSNLELMVHEPVPPERTEVISYWGWPAEYPSWNWAGEEGKSLQVSVYTTCPKVHLELNGRMIGEQTILADSGITAVFDVPYEPGILKAVGFDNGQEVAAKILKTSGSPAGIKLIPDRSIVHADRSDLAYITIEVVDKDGNRVPDAEVIVNLNLNGAGELLAAGNAKPDYMASFRDTNCMTYRGRALAIIRPTTIAGSIELTAEAEGLSPGSLLIQTK